MGKPGIADVPPWRDFPSAARGALAFLHEYLGWDVWTVTRVTEGRQIVLHAQPADAVPPGAWIPWLDSFCRHMVSGDAPRAATVTAAVPAYAAQMTGSLSNIAAYIGVPLVGADGSLFGTLCGWAYRARPRSANRDLPLVEFAARMLSSLMAAGLRAPEPPDLVPPEV